jgi:hypothetical protein
MDQLAALAGSLRKAAVIAEDIADQHGRYAYEAGATLQFGHLLRQRWEEGHASALRHAAQQVEALAVAGKAKEAEAPASLTEILFPGETK